MKICGRNSLLYGEGEVSREVKGILGKRSSLSKSPRYEMLWWFVGVARMSYDSSLKLREEAQWKVRGGWPNMKLIESEMGR